MSDLISRSELLKRFCVNKHGHRIPERDCDNFDVTVSVKDAKTIIKEQPSAYDVDKVVEKLNELEVKENTRYKNGDFGDFDGLYYYIKKSDAIEIVKHGGVSDDVYKPSADKIKVTSLEVIVTGSKRKPYFEIKYKEVGTENYNIGYSSYNLDFVLDWKEKCFELVKVVE